MAKVNFSTDMKANGGVNLGKKPVQIASEEIVGMDNKCDSLDEAWAQAASDEVNSNKEKDNGN